MLRRVGLFALTVALASGVVRADSATDLTGYVTTDKAVTTKIKREAPQQAAHLGLAVESANGQMRVTDVEPGSPAEKAGIVANDLVTSIDGVKVSDRDTIRRLIQDKRPGEFIALATERAGKSSTAKVKLAPASNPLRDTTLPPPVMGVTLVETGHGMRIEDVKPGSPAAAAGLQSGDVVQKVNGGATPSWEALRSRLSSHSPGEKVQVAFVRNDRQMQADVELSAPRIVEDMPTLAGWNDRHPNVFRGPVYKLAVIPIQFVDQKLNEKLNSSTWDAAIFSTGQYKDRSPTGQAVHGSVNDYYQEISYGKFKLEGKVFMGVTVSRARSEYMEVANRWALQTEACDVLLKREGEDALKDYDGIFFIYAGPRVSTQRGGIFWPHRATFRHKGKTWNYFICPEGGERMFSISVICHEFGHMIGLPDLYSRPEAAETQDVGIWCSMSIGHGQNGRPLHFSAWCKEQMGWLKPVVIDPRVKQKLVLRPVGTSDQECYKVLLRPDGEEYLLLENRKRVSFDKDLPAEGMLIWRVVNGRPILEEAHGIIGPGAARKFLGSVPYPSISNTAFTPDTTPSSRPTMTGGWNVYINYIRKLPDGRITFQIGHEYF